MSTKKSYIHPAVSRADMQKALQIIIETRNKLGIGKDDDANQYSLDAPLMPSVDSKSIANVDVFFAKEPYGLELSFRDVFGLMVELDELWESNLFGNSDDEFELLNFFYNSMPKQINSDDDFLSWFECLEKDHSIDLKPYDKTLIDFKASFPRAKKNQQAMTTDRIETIQGSACDFICDKYTNKNIACLNSDQIEIALKKRQEALDLLSDIEDMFGVIKNNL